jgi:hypothetical protein
MPFLAFLFKLNCGQMCRPDKNGEQCYFTVLCHFIKQSNDNTGSDDKKRCVKEGYFRYFNGF